MTYFWPLSFPKIFPNCHVFDKNGNFLKILAMKICWRNYESSWVRMSHVLWLYLGKKCWICKPELYFGSSVSHFDSLAILFWDELGREWELVKRGGWWRHHAASKRPSLETKIQTASRSRDLLCLTIDLSFWVLTKNAEFGRFFLWWDEMNGSKKYCVVNMKTRTGIFEERRRMVTDCPERRPEILNLPDFYWGKYWFGFLKPIVHKSFWWNVSTDDVVLKNNRILRHNWNFKSTIRGRISPSSRLHGPQKSTVKCD